MVLKAYSIYDRKGFFYHPPFFQAADGLAVRMFGDLCNDPQTQMGRHPNDFVLFAIGEYDDQKGQLAAYSPLVHVVDGTSLVNQRDQQPNLFTPVPDDHN